MQVPNLVIRPSVVLQQCDQMDFADAVAGPDSGPESPFPLKLDGKVIKGFGRGSSEVSGNLFSSFWGRRVLI